MACIAARETGVPFHLPGNGSDAVGPGGGFRVPALCCTADRLGHRDSRGRDMRRCAATSTLAQPGPRVAAKRTVPPAIRVTPDRSICYAPTRMATDTNRREFLGGVAIASALAGSPPRAGAAEAGETSWEGIRGLFPFREERVPMNAANLCPSPGSVAQSVTDLTRSIDVDCSFQNRERFAGDRETARALVAGQLGAEADEVALVRNTSEANNIINNGLDLGAGDEVVIWDQNHPTNNVAWAVRARRRGFTVRSVTVPASPSDPDDLIQPFLRALTPNTRVLALTHASNISGILLPVRELCSVARRSGVHVHVDGAQTWGALQVDLHGLGCDSYAASAHKWFCGPKEVGLLYVRRERVEGIWPGTVAPGWGSTADTELVGARKFESMGQRDDAALSALGVAAEFHASIGTAKVEARVRELASVLKQSLDSIGARLITPGDKALSAGVCIVEVEPERRQALFEAMYDDFGIAGSTAGGFRLCPHIYNTREHVERAVRGLEAHRGLWA